MSTKWWTEYLYPKRPLQAALALCLAVSVAVASGCSLLPKEDEEEALPTISPPKLSQKPTHAVKKETMETKAQGIGKLLPLKEEELFFMGQTDSAATGSLRIKEVHVKSGQTVAAGEVIAELDVADKVRELRRAKLEFRREELNMIAIMRKADEYEPEELEQLKIDFELKRTTIVDLEEAIANAQLTAPFSGTIAALHVKRGDTVQPYGKVATIADLSSLAVTAQFSKDDLSGIAVGMEAVVTINAAGTHKGKVERLPTQTNDNNNGAPDENPEAELLDKYLLVSLDAWPEGVTRGTPLSVTVITNRKENAVVIPPAALRSYNGRSYVQVVDNEGNKREVDVEVGMKTATQIEILKGLEPGQKVVGR
jgi:macrolide-specific efflux system membrane fusion protein